ncbi:polyketide synthase [Nonomuraea ferruginea]
MAPGDVGYVELHGTGTRVGDPVEAAALGAAYGTARQDGDPLPVGSVKTNIGHLEGAAGIAGLLKVVLAIKHRELPASLHFASPPPEIPLTDLRLRVVRETVPWAAGGRLVAGVSSFGMGGTNCHLLLAEPPPRSPEPEDLARTRPEDLDLRRSGDSPAPRSPRGRGRRVAVGGLRAVTGGVARGGGLGSRRSRRSPAPSRTGSRPAC